MVVVEVEAGIAVATTVTVELVELVGLEELEELEEDNKVAERNNKVSPDS